MKADIEDIIFDGREELLEQSDKEAYYLYKCMSFLSDYYTHSIFRDNPIIRFNDDKTVKVEKYMQV